MPWRNRGLRLLIDLCFLLLFSDVLCPSLRVEGDRFKHTNGETKEITGKRVTATLHGLLSVLFAGLDHDPP